MTLPARNQTEAYLLAEIPQAWAHYRHMEETRTKYLSFFATVILTSAGFLVTLLKDLEKFDPVQLVAAIAIFVFLLFVFSFFVWANISRIGFVLAAYEVILMEMRKYMLGDGSTAYLLWNVRGRIPPPVSAGVFRIQSAASAIVVSVCALLLAAELYLTYLVVSATVRAPLWLAFGTAFFSMVIMGLMSRASYQLRKARSYRQPPAELSRVALYQGESDAASGEKR